MNSYVRNSRTFALVISGHSIRGGYEALRQVVDLYDNDDTVSLDYAEQAFDDGRPAYWSTASYHNQVACCLLNAANLMHSLDAAIDSVVRPHKRDRLEAYLDTLIPLNADAETELSLAYARHTGTWRDEHELARRRVRKMETA